jgi:uncharacterized protein (TIGR02266 family)
MAARHGPDELGVKEHQLEGWEEKLTLRAQALAESARALQQRKAAVAPLVSKVQARGGPLPSQVHELLSAEPLVDSPHVAAAQQQAQQARKHALDARVRAAQAWEEDLTRQTAALNAVLQGLVSAHKELQSQVEALSAQAPEPLRMVKEPAIPQAAPRSRPPPPPATAPNGANNRAHARARLRVQVDFESDHNFFTGFSSDISEGGLFVATVNIQPLGSPVEVAFALPTGEQVMARGVVRWIREASDRDVSVQPGMGIQFEHLSEDAREAVNAFINQREPMFYTD